LIGYELIELIHRNKIPLRCRCGEWFFPKGKNNYCPACNESPAEGRVPLRRTVGYLKKHVLSEKELIARRDAQSKYMRSYRKILQKQKTAQPHPMARDDKIKHDQGFQSIMK
jgi:hypothetical protein